MKLEVACFNLESAKIAANAEADRIEFCDNYSIGGITPNLIDFIKLRNYTNRPIFVMIRTRGGNFVFNESEQNIMLSSIKQFIEHGANGLVFGCLTLDNKVDFKANKILIEAANNLPCTFHRAFDKLDDYKNGLEQIIELGFKNILTSGGASHAIEGLQRLNQIQKLTLGKIELVCGGGIRSSNISEIKNLFSTNYYHSSGIINKGTIADRKEIEQLKYLLKH